MSQLSHYEFLFLTPLKLECESLLKSFKDLGLKFKTKVHHHKSYHFCETYPFVLSHAGLGKVEYALGVYQAYTFLKQEAPQLQNIKCLCIGGAGSLDPQLQIGDLILGVQTIEHDFKSVFYNYKKPEFRASQEIFDLLDLNAEEKSALCKIQNHSHNSLGLKSHLINSREPLKEFNVYLGRIASGDEDILTESRALEIAQETYAHAVAWEGAGGARACKTLGVPFLELRGITDLCNEHTVHDFKKNLDLTFKNIAHFLESIYKI